MRSRVWSGLTLGSLLITLTTAAACAPQGQRHGRGIGPRPSDYIALEELESIQASSAWDAIYRLRPRFLTGHRGGGPPVVLIDGRHAGPPGALRSVPAEDVMDIQFVSPAEATTRLGISGNSGAIVLRTRTAVGSR